MDNNLKVPKNILSDLLDPSIWDTNDLREPIISYYNRVEGGVDQMAKWYMKRKSKEKLASRFCRGLSIFFVIVGGIFPIAVGAGLPQSWGMIGYIFIAFAGAFIAAEKLFCFSSQWRRCVLTSFELKEKLKSFHNEWGLLLLDKQKGNWTPEFAKKAITVIHKFEKERILIMKEETTIFFQEFEGILAQLEKRVTLVEKTQNKEI